MKNLSLTLNPLKINFLSRFFFALVMLFLSAPTFAITSLQGKVIDDTGEPILFGNVVLYQDGKLISGIQTDFDGNYLFENIEPGTYSVLASYVGYADNKIDKVEVKADQVNVLNITLSTGGLVLDEVVVGYKIPLSGRKKSSGKKIFSGRKKHASASSSSSSSWTTKSKEVAVSGSRTASTDYHVDGKREKSSITSPAPASVLEDADMDGISEMVIIEESEIMATDDYLEAAGQLTAGEWRDLDNWTFWNKLMTDTDFKNMQNYWDLYPNKRFSVFFNDQQDRPVADAQVLLKNNKGNIVWKARTDNTGKVELWGNFFNEKDLDFKLEIKTDGKKKSFKPSSFDKSQNIYSIDKECETKNKVDLAFVVDVTGSMSDELNFLKAEMTDVINRTKEENENINIRTSAVFYKDLGDDYVTRLSPFTPNTEKTSQFIKSTSTGGGGDTPEAVHTALEKAINELEWSSDALSRILFLVLDAPPHHNPKVMDSLKKSIQKAAEKGIKIIPITGSGIDKETEFLMKFMAVATNGTYVFLTDHSGIGGSHLEPEAESYNIEMLNDLMVRLILENTTYHTCDTPSTQNNNQQQSTALQQVIKGLDFKIKCYPNPTVNRFSVDLEKPIDLLIISDSKGQEIKRVGDLQIGKTTIDVSSLAAGTYALQFVDGKKHTTEKLVIIRP